MFGKKKVAEFYAEQDQHYAGSAMTGTVAQLSVLGTLTTFAQMSQAAIDITTVTTGITDAGTAILAVIGGLLALSVSIFGIVKVYKFVSAKAGA